MSETETTPVPTPEKKSTRQMSFAVLDNGDVVANFGPGLDPIQFTPSALPESIFPQAVTKGMIAQLRESTSKLADAARTPQALRDAVAKTLDLLKAGTWRVERASGTSEISMEAEAAHVYRAKRAAEKGEEYTATLEEDAAAFAALSDEQKSKLRETARYKLALAQVKADRATKKAAALEKKVAEDEGEVEF